MHEKTNYKASEWNLFNESMHGLVKQSNQVTEMAIIDRGVYRYRDPYQYLRVDQLKWIRMTAKQRELHIRKVATTAVVGPLDGIDDPVPSDSDYSPLSIGPDEAKLKHLPLETVRGIGKKPKISLQHQVV